MKLNFRRIIFNCGVIFGGALLGLSCAHLHSVPPIDITQMSVEDIHDRLEQNYLRLATLNGKARIQAQLQDQGYEATTHIQMLMPDSLFFKVEAFLGLDVGTFFSNRKQFALYSPFQKVLYTGHLDSLDLAQFFQVDLTYDELLEACTGIPRIKMGKTTPLKKDDAQIQFSTQEAQGMHQYWIDPVKFVVTKYQFWDAQGVLQVTTNFSRFQKIDNLFLPKSIQIYKPVPRQVFSLYYEERVINQPLNKKDFKIQVPPKTRIIKL
ncbi:DUF4292 domain-containing protein [candidate division KSB1 bacterium]|nr:DUF4292 domain-containing protein [candidate division KSB1 bacterium]